MTWAAVNVRLKEKLLHGSLVLAFSIACYKFLPRKTRVVTVFPVWPPNEKEGAGRSSRKSNSANSVKKIRLGKKSFCTEKKERRRERKEKRKGFTWMKDNWMGRHWMHSTWIRVNTEWASQRKIHQILRYVRFFFPKGTLFVHAPLQLVPFAAL